MKHNKLKIIYIGGLISSCVPISFTLSCAVEPKDDMAIDQTLKSHFVDWYNSLSKSEWNKDENGNFINYHCNSEQQAIALYANFRGWYWNESLHKQEEPKTQIVDLNLDKGKPHEVRGSDYKKVVQALDRSIFPYDMEIYHGVEYQEDEFWDQLKDLVEIKDGKYDFSKTIGSTIQSHGFISTSLSKKEAHEYCDGWNWVDNKIHLPLKEKTVFYIKIKKGYKGAAYLADFSFAGTVNQDNQVLLNKGAKFKINDIKRDGDINIFYLDLI